jgi:hypothetical protein
MLSIAENGQERIKLTYTKHLVIDRLCKTFSGVTPVYGKAVIGLVGPPGGRGSTRGSELPVFDSF